MHVAEEVLTPFYDNLTYVILRPPISNTSLRTGVIIVSLIRTTSAVRGSVYATMKPFVLGIVATFAAVQIVIANDSVGTQTPTNEIDGTFDSASYDTPPYKLWGDYFASHFYDMYPQFTNHIYSVSRSGASWENQFKSQQEKWCLPLWASCSPVKINDWMLANDNGAFTSNDVVQWGTNLFNAPPLFWNGTAVTNEGGIASTLSVTHYSLGGIPSDSPSGDGRAVSRNDGAMALAQLYGTPVVDMWHLLWTNGLSSDVVGPRLFGFYPGSHPFPAGNLCMALQGLVALGVETNVGSLTLNWFGASASTNHCVVSGITVAASTLACVVHFDRMPMAWDVPMTMRWDVPVPNSTITNDARNAFVIMPELGNAFQWTIRVTNAPPGTYAMNMDGVLTDTATDTELAAGRNWFTNYNGSLWAQRASVLAWKRIQAGCDPITLFPQHGAGSPGVLGTFDLLNYQSFAAHNYDILGLRGDAYINSMTNQVAHLRLYDLAINEAAQQTNHALSITLITIGPTTNASIAKVLLSGTNLVIEGTNNNVPNTNFQYVVLVTTNLATPLSNWTPIATNGFKPDGTFDFTNTIVPGSPQEFFNVKAVP